MLDPERMFEYDRAVLAAQWDELRSEVVARRAREKSADAVADLNARTGLEWSDPGIPGKLPATPAERDLDAALRCLSRRLRRQWSRALDTFDGCGAYEVLGILYDASVEEALIGEDRRCQYLEHLAECGYGPAVFEFIRSTYDWIIGADSECAWAAAWLLVLAATYESPVPGVADMRSTDPPRAMSPPLTCRPAVSQHAPPPVVARATGSAGRSVA